jgi:hypothetical protein
MPAKLLSRKRKLVEPRTHESIIVPFAHLKTTRPRLPASGFSESKLAVATRA